MPDKIREKFNSLFPTSEYVTQAMREALYEVFEKGYTYGQKEAKNATQSDLASSVGYYIPVIEYESGWGAKTDGYMVGFTPYDLDERRKIFEKGNSREYGLYYDKLNTYTQVHLSEEAIKKLLAVKKEHGHTAYWFKSIGDFKKNADQ